MPGLYRKIAIYAAVEGLILHAHGSAEQHKYLQVNYKTRRISEYEKSNLPSVDGLPRLEAYGLIGIMF